MGLESPKVPRWEEAADTPVLDVKRVIRSGILMPVGVLLVSGILKSDEHLKRR